MSWFPPWNKSGSGHSSSVIDGLRGEAGGRKESYLAAHLAAVQELLRRPLPAAEVLVIGDALDDASASQLSGLDASSTTAARIRQSSSGGPGTRCEVSVRGSGGGGDSLRLWRRRAATVTWRRRAVAQEGFPDDQPYSTALNSRSLTRLW